MRHTLPFDPESTPSSSGFAQIVGKIALAPYKGTEMLLSAVGEEFRGFATFGLLIAEGSIGALATVAALGAGPVAAGATAAMFGGVMAETAAAYFTGGQ